MVKGLSRRVIVVKTPDPRFFEEAIFILRDALFQQSGVTEDQLLREARQAAAGCLSAQKRALPHDGLTALFWLLLGATLTGVAWLLTLMFTL